MILTYKYKLKGKRAARQLCRYAWAVNQVWNFCVQTQRKVQRTWKDGLSVKWLSQYGLQKLAGGTSIELGVHAQTIQSTCDQFAKSRDLHKGCPRFRKSSGSKKSLGWVPFQKQSRQITSNSITYLGNTYQFFGSKRRPLPVNAKGGAFVEDAQGNWWVTFHVEVGNLLVASNRHIGIDLGLKELATLSNGTKIENIGAFRSLEIKLTTAQRANNKQRTRAINKKIANIRRDHLHKTTSKIASEYRAVFVGDVSSSKLAKTKMAKSVYDAGWFFFKNTLRYKVSRHGGVFFEVNEKGSTRICSSCGVVPPGSPKGIADLGMREWECSSCGVAHDRDVNAAKNILTFGLGVQPLAEESRVAHGR